MMPSDRAQLPSVAVKSKTKPNMRLLTGVCPLADSSRDPELCHDRVAKRAARLETDWNERLHVRIPTRLAIPVRCPSRLGEESEVRPDRTCRLMIFMMWLIPTKKGAETKADLGTLAKGHCRTAQGPTPHTGRGAK
jgi:hypothetical protein